ncbi:MAG: hypothetical protein EoVTN8_829 [Fluviibacter phosphoraccumulans EoVTN8]
MSSGSVGRNRCGWAVSASVAIHLFVIFPLAFDLYTPIAMPQAPLSAVLCGAGDTAQTAKADAKKAPLSAGDTKKLNPVKPVPIVKAKHGELAPEKTKLVQPTQVGVAQGDAAAAPNLASKAGTLGGAPESARDGVDADALQRYRLALGVEARKARRYPEVLRARGHEGVCEEVIVLSKNGGAPVVLQGKSSGSQTLDEAAFTMARLAAERTPVPAELGPES